MMRWMWCGCDDVDCMDDCDCELFEIYWLIWYVWGLMCECCMMKKMWLIWMNFVLWFYDLMMCVWWLNFLWIECEINFFVLCWLRWFENEWWKLMMNAWILMIEVGWDCCFWFDFFENWCIDNLWMYCEWCDGKMWNQKWGRRGRN